MKNPKARPQLNSIPLKDVLPIRQDESYATMSLGQWDTFLQSAYFEGFVLLEVNDKEEIIAAYKMNGEQQAQ